MGNMFKDANEKRRSNIIKENIHVADEVMDSGRLRENFLLQKPDRKVRRTISLNEDVDKFYSELCEITGITRSNIMENILDIAITESKEIRELARENPKVHEILEIYMENIKNG